MTKHFFKGIAAFMLFIFSLSISVAQNRIIVNPSFETGSFTPYSNSFRILRSQAAPNPQLDGWYSTHPTYTGNDGSGPVTVEAPIEQWANGFSGVPSQAGNYFIELNVSQPSRLYQIVYLVNGEIINYTYHHRNRGGVTETVEFNIYNQATTPVKIQTLNTHSATSTNSWDVVTGSAAFTGASGVYTIGFEATAPASGGSGNFLDNVTIGLSGLCEFPAAAVTVNEGDSFDPKVIINGNVSSPSTITFTVTGGTAVEGVDYNFTPKTINIPVGQYGLADAFSMGFNLINNTLSQVTRTVIIAITSVTGALTAQDANGDGNVQTITITINDNDPQAGGVPGTNLWLKANIGASNSGANLTGWTDQSGINTFAVVGAPTLNSNAINFNNAISFNNDGLSSSLPTNYLAGNINIDYVSAFSVYKFDDNSFGQSNFLGSVDNPSTLSRKGVVIFGGSGTNNSWVRGGAEASAEEEFRIQNTEFDNRKINIVNLDAALIGSPFGTGRVNGLNQPILGGPPDINVINFKPLIGGTNNNGSNNFGHMKANGLLAEIIIFPTTQTEAEKRKIETYLAIKYGITLSSSTTSFDYVSSSGNIVWTANTTYQYDVFGIGKDDASGLNQTQSNSMNTGSGNGTGQNGKGNLVISNATDLDNGEFLMIGHDNLALNEQFTDLPVGLQRARLKREWKVQHTGNVGTVTVKLDISSLPIGGGANLTDFIMLIDEDGNGDFTNGTVTQVPASAFGSVIFNNVTLNNGVVFTFVTSPFRFPLPLNLLSFEAGTANCTSDVKWQTTNEVNVSRFELQVNYDNNSWSTIYTHAAYNNTNENNYSFKYNHSSLSGNKLLRLKMIDKDGNFTYSRIISVQCGKDQVFSVYPNPARTQVTLTGTKASEQLQIISIDGKMLQQQTTTIGNTTINIEALPAGSYFIRILRNKQWTRAGQFEKL